MQAVQLTSGACGHMLNSTQVFSPDDQWVVYDTRNDQTHIGRTCCIGKVNIITGEVVRLYSATGQTEYGPGVGAAAYHPFRDQVIFIHGLLNCDESRPYAFTRRFGAIVDEGLPGRIIHAEARSVEGPLVPGALRGGTHAHSWSADGEWISFTYNDRIMEKLEQAGRGRRDLRTIGVMAPGKHVTVPAESAEDFSGTYFSVVAATVTESPRPGSDEVERALDECWVGTKGYVKKDGTRQNKALAFQGVVKSKDGTPLTEIFISDIPDDISKAVPGQPLEGTADTRPSVPEGLAQRRVTFTADRKYPGVQGPRFWLRSSPDGAFIYFLMKDDQGTVQVYEVPSTGGDPRQVTRLKHPVQTQFNISPDGRSLALIADNSIWSIDIKTGASKRLTKHVDDEDAPLGGALWNRAGTSVVYNRYVKDGGDRYLQIFKLEVN